MLIDRTTDLCVWGVQGGDTGRGCRAGMQGGLEVGWDRSKRMVVCTCHQLMPRACFETIVSSWWRCGPNMIRSHIFFAVSTRSELIAANSMDTSRWRVRNKPCILKIQNV